MKKLLMFLCLLPIVACTCEKENPVLSIEGGLVQGVNIDIDGVIG